MGKGWGWDDCEWIGFEALSFELDLWTRLVRLGKTATVRIQSRHAIVASMLFQNPPPIIQLKVKVLEFLTGHGLLII